MNAVSMTRMCLVLTLFLLAAARTHGQQATAPGKIHPRVELSNTEVREIQSAINGERYKIYLKLPRGYVEGTKRYPVLYVLDAETNFGGVSYIVQRLIKDRIIPEVLVVGIAYGVSYDTFYRLRTRDLAPGVDRRFVARGARAGGAEAFRKLIETELFPFIGKNYRVQGDSRALYGHSLGGLFGFYTLLESPQMFDKYILLSPSLWWADQAIFKRVENASLPQCATRLYVGTGEHENRKHHAGQSMVDHQLEMVRLLAGRESRGLVIRSEILENETHRTIFGTAFTKGLRFVYDDWRREPAKSRDDRHGR